jgi:hexosaminidase
VIPVELGMQAFVLLISLGLFSGLISAWIFQRWSDRALLRSAVNRVLAHLLEFHLFSAEPGLLLRAQRDLVLSNLRVLRLATIPSLLLIVPFAVCVAIVNGFFTRALLRPGQAAVVTAQYMKTDSALPALTLRTPPGIEVDAGPVRVPRERQISWRVRVFRSSAGSMEIASSHETVRKTISAHPGLQWISAAPLGSSGLESVSISYPAASVFHTSPLLWFVLGSLIGVALYLPLTSLSLSTSAFLALLLACTPALRADSASPLFARGYTVLPQPQKVAIGAEDFVIDFPHWSLQPGSSVPADSEAVESLTDGLRERFKISLGKAGDGACSLHLDIVPGSVEPGAAQDRDRESISTQAYRLTLNPRTIQITANAPVGLFYGVQTFLQLLKPHDGAFQLPTGEITDWPDLGQRHIYWDDAHHLDRMPDLEAAIRQAAFFKINGFAIKLEGHFEFQSAPAVTEPQALSPAELQHLTDYGLRRHVQVIPYLDAPSHIAFILKHPEYAGLRAFPDSNYELCTVNPDSVKLMRGMYDDLLAANKGGKYFYLSTDEAYYIGLAKNSQCDEAARAAQLGSRGKLLAEFLDQTAGYLHSQGREVIFWGEHPLKPDDIPALPSFLINGETYGPKFDPAFRARGIRQMIYGSVEGEERLFPHYFLLPLSRRIHTTDEDFPRVSDALEKIGTDTGRSNANLIGLVIAGWGDMGLHNETFWMGYATVTAGGWHNPENGGPEAMSSFYPLWYGASARNMNRLYQLMSFQAQVWVDTWEQTDSKSRPGIWGDSERIFSPRKPAHDAHIPLPPVPAEDLQYRSTWSRDNSRRLTVANDAVSENDELIGLLNENIRQAQWHRYGLEVFLSVAQLCRQNLDFLAAWRRIDELLTESSGIAKKGEPERALRSADEALDAVCRMKAERNRVQKEVVATWYESWLPRVVEANGRRFLHQVDDVKDHLPDRTTDMNYLVYRELQLPVEDWYARVQEARNACARAHGLPLRSVPLAWNATE